MNRLVRRIGVTASCCVLAGTLVYSADQTILGKSFLIKDPQPNSPTLRKIVVLGKEPAPDDSVLGDPTVGGATVEVIATGSGPNGGSQLFTMPASGWIRVPSNPASALVGYKYVDPNPGALGPVKTALIKRPPNNAPFILKVVILGANGPGAQPHITQLPPAPGDDGGVIFTIGGSERYCMTFGGPSGGKVVNSPSPSGEKGFKVVSTAALPTKEATGCPGQTPTTTTTGTTSTTVSTTTTATTTNTTTTTITTTPANPLTLVFKIDSSLVPAGENENTIQVFKDKGPPIPVCTGAPNTASPDPCVGARDTAGDDVLLTILTSKASLWDFGVPTTTTTTSTTSTTICPSQLHFSTQTGTTQCGGRGFNPIPVAPFSGALFSNTGCTTAIANANLGVGCLYFGGGNNTQTAPNQNPDGPTSIFDVASCAGTLLNLTAHPRLPDNNAATCTEGPLATKHCGKNPAIACTVGSDCTAPTGAPFCQPDAQCYFGPPLPVAALGNESCVVNVISANPSGTIDKISGVTNLNLPLSSRTYLTANSTDPCPRCIGGLCNAGKRVGLACTPVGSKLTTLDCLPDDNALIGDLAISLNPLRSSPQVVQTASTGIFCPPNPPAGGLGQTTAGAFGKTLARCITEAGSDPGNLTPVGTPKSGQVAAIFCIPATANSVVNGVAGLPGPGAVNIKADFMLVQ